MTTRAIIRLVIAVVSAVGALAAGHQAAWASLRDGSHRLFVLELDGVGADWHIQ